MDKRCSFIGLLSLLSCLWFSRLPHGKLRIHHVIALLLIITNSMITENVNLKKNIYKEYVLIGENEKSSAQTQHN